MPLVALVWLFRPPSLEFLDQPYSTIIKDKEGVLLSAQIASDEQWRFPIFEGIPNKFEKSIITFEDKRFFMHPGVDPLALLRAIKLNISKKKIVSGASTLTMQLMRIAKGSQKRSFWNKIKEMHGALRLELWHTKADILKWYSSLAPFGGNVIGVEAASWRYFNKEPNQLTWSESATLAVLPNAPSLIHINRNRAALLSKRNGLLVRLHQRGFIDSIGLEAALMEPLPGRFYNLPNEAPHYLQFEKRSNTTGVIESSIDRYIQRSVHELLNQHYLEWRDSDVHNAAVIILDTNSGEILSYHGNIPDTKEEKMVDMIQAERSSGSILKPFLFGHMIDERLMSPTSLVLDIPTYISGFNPSNYNKTFSGAVAADVALQKSLNVPAVRQLQAFGIEKFLTYLKRHGFSTLNLSADHYGLSLILGGGEVTLFELAEAYHEMGRRLLDDDVVNPLSAAAIYQTFESLKGLSRPDEEGDWHRMDSRAPIAWKTGTSYGHRDAWAVGVTPEITIATWVGNADGEGRDGIIGNRMAGKLLFAVLGIMEVNPSWFDPPIEEMAYLNVCLSSGHLAGPNCEKVDTILWPQITESTSICPYHKKYFVTADGNHRFIENCNLGEGRLKSFFELSPQVAHFYKRSHPEYIQVPKRHPNCRDHVTQTDMEFLYPLENDVVFLPKDLNGVQQKLISKLVHRNSDAKLFWYLNDDYLGTTENFHSMALIPAEGIHHITVVDHQGQRLTRKFFVKGKNEKS